MKSSKKLVVLVGAFFLVFLADTNGGETTGRILSSNIATSRLNEGMPFLSARARLIKAGWVPIHLHANDHYEYIGAERRLIENNIFEVDFCSVDRGALCAIYYVKEKSCLRVDTVGEQVQWMRVTGWREECPEGQHPAGEKAQQ